MTIRKKSVWFWLFTSVGLLALIVVLIILLISTVQALRIRNQAASTSNLSSQELASKALTQQQNDDLAGAEASLQEALVRETNINYQSQLAVVKYRLKKYSESIALFQELVKAEQQVAFAWNGIGNAYRDWADQSNGSLKSEREELALQAYIKAVEADNGFATAYINRAIFLDDLGRTEEAVVVAEAGLKATARQELQDLVNRLKK